MEGLTLGQIAVGLALVAGLITSVSLIVKHLKTWLKKTLQSEFDGLKGDIQKVSKSVENVDKESCKNYLVTVLSGVEKGNKLDEIERERLYEEFEHYKTIGGNSYIRRKFEQLQTEGKL